MVWTKARYFDAKDMYASRHSNAHMCQSLCDLYGSYIQSQGMALPDMLRAGAYQDFLESVLERNHYFGMLVQEKVDGSCIKLVGTISAEIEISDCAIPVATCFALQTIDVARNNTQQSQQRKEYLFNRLLLYALRLEQYESDMAARAVGLRMAGESMPHMFFFDAQRRQFRCR